MMFASSGGRGILMLFVLSLSMGCSAPTPKVAQPTGGILDLRGYDFSKGQNVPLTGLWEFLPGSLDVPYADFEALGPSLRKVPDLWRGDEAGGHHGHGSGSYHLTVLLPPDTPLLALHYTSASTAFRIEVQGKTVAQVGVPSTDPKTAVAAYRPGFVRLEPVRDRLDIMVRVSNYVYRSGGLWYPIFLGSAESVESIHLSEFAVALVQFTALAVMGSILILLFVLRRKDRYLLFSGLFALVLALRILVTGEYIITRYWPSIPFALMIRLEYFTVSAPFPISPAFFVSLFPQLMGRALKWAPAV